MTLLFYWIYLAFHIFILFGFLYDLIIASFDLCCFNQSIVDSLSIRQIEADTHNFYDCQWWLQQQQLVRNLHRACCSWLLSIWNTTKGWFICWYCVSLLWSSSFILQSFDQLINRSLSFIDCEIAKGKNDIEIICVYQAIIIWPSSVILLPTPPPSYNGNLDKYSHLLYWRTYIFYRKNNNPTNGFNDKTRRGKSPPIEHV